jgi:hypothetical protein
MVEKESAAVAADMAAARRGRETRTLGIGAERGTERVEEAATGAVACR